jgi:hypothetical protein
LQERTGVRRKNELMARSPAPIVAHRLTLAEQRVLSSFLSGRLPAGQVHAELERARVEPAPATQPAPAVQPVPAVAA